MIHFLAGKNALNSELHIYYGEQSSLLNWHLPEGPYFDNHKQDLYVKVTDSKGAMVETFIATVRVRVPG